MNTNVLPKLRPAEPAIIAESNPFLRALKNIEYGNLTITTPEGEVLKFSGSKPGGEADMTVRNWKVFDDLVARGQIGFADTYMDGNFESKDLPTLITFILDNTPALEDFFYGKPWYAVWMRWRNRLNNNSLKGSRRNIVAHYDLGNDFYSLWLDKGMTYSGALFEGDANRSLEDAQQAKYRRILNKLGAKPGEHILEIGCGWGGFAEIAAKDGIKVTGLTISTEQAQYANQRLKRQGLSKLASVKLTDYRKITKQYDYIVSIGMFEHVGEQYWLVYFETIKRCLKPGGKAMIQSITLDDELFEELQNRVGFIEYYIFPGGKLPSKTRFRQAAENAGLQCREMFAFGQDYARTLSHWLKRYEEQAENIKKLGFDAPFMRLWKFYLAACIATFLTKRSDVMQAEIVHS